MNLYLDLYKVDEHPQVFMNIHGIKYEEAIPQSIADCWLFFKCTNVPDSLPIGLSVLNRTASQYIGYGINANKAKELDNPINI